MVSSSLAVDPQLIARFEQGLDPRRPEQSQIPARVLGYGEISTVLAIDDPAGRGLAFKRLAMFNDLAEARPYLALYDDYVAALREAGLALVPAKILHLAAPSGREVVYIIQERLPAASIGHQAIHYLAGQDVQRLFRAVLGEAGRVFAFNRSQAGRLAVGFDAQISNWAIADFDLQAGRLPEPLVLRYFDTSTPLLRRDGREQLDPELFLRSAPSFLVWIIRLFLLEEVMNRYYDQRRVTIDLIANFYKEGRPELIPELVATANDVLGQVLEPAGFEPISPAEVAAYYKDDARTWRIYLAFRRFDRTLHRLAGKEYPYILPGTIRR